MPRHCIICPEEFEKIEWQKIYDSINRSGRERNRDIIESLKKIEAAKNQPISGESLFNKTFTAEEINNLLRVRKLPYRLYSPQKNKPGRDTAKSWCVGRSCEITKENRFQQLTPRSLLIEFVTLTRTDPNSANWRMCRDEILRRMSPPDSHAN